MRSVVVEVRCTRCTRVEHKSEESAVEPVSFSASLGDSKVSFEDLCDNCVGVIRGYLDQIAKPICKASRGKKKG